MLVVAFHGGLGNQIFQYCFLRKLQKLFPDEVVKADLSRYKVTDYHQGFELDKIFLDININSAASKELIRILREIPRIYGGPGRCQVENLREKVSNWLFKPEKEIKLYEEKYLELYFSGKLREYLSTRQDWYIEGFWENINYYSNDLLNIKKGLKFINITEYKNKKLAENLRGQNAVSVHIRRGDFVNSSMDVLNEEYYRRAMKYIEERLENPVYYFFSDDPEFVKKYYGDVKNKQLVDWNKGKKSFRDMQLMSLCKCNIIANSTFSQWGALLNQNSESLVVYPSKKRKNKEMENVHLDNWHRIEV